VFPCYGEIASLLISAGKKCKKYRSLLHYLQVKSIFPKDTLTVSLYFSLFFQGKLGPKARVHQRRTGGPGVRLRKGHKKKGTGPPLAGNSAA
jgi:hypothetical protein